MRTILNSIKSRYKRGFTLVELLVVVIILGVLAVITVPTYNKLIRKSRVSDGLNVLEMLASAQEKYYVQNETYAGRMAKLNAPLKDRWQDNINNTDKLDTTNFTYSKGTNSSQVTSNCIYAASRDPKMNYTLVKNYKTHSKTGCMGPDCAKLTEYVGAAAEGLCPPGQECYLTNDDCEYGVDPELCACNYGLNPDNCAGIEPLPNQNFEGADCAYYGQLCTHQGGYWHWVYDPNYEHAISYGDCLPGAEQDCLTPNGLPGKRTCEDTCYWGSCVPSNPIPPIPPIIPPNSECENGATSTEGCLPGDCKHCVNNEWTA